MTFPSTSIHAPNLLKYNFFVTSVKIKTSKTQSFPVSKMTNLKKTPIATRFQHQVSLQFTANHKRFYFGKRIVYDDKW